MQILTTHKELITFRARTQTIGFVPTMGALHAGHLGLITQAQKEGNTATICSIFVNPLQFNDPKDLEKYPRPIAADIEKLASVGCDVLFLPTVEEMYPQGLELPVFEFGNLDKTMEGAHRVGHFKGMSQVVYRLLDMVQPDALYMGQKDFQQFAIVQNMLAQTGWDAKIRLVCSPIARETDGLAMSSRNIRLSTEGRAKAANISQILLAAAKQAYTHTPESLADWIMTQYRTLGFEEIDYVEVIDAKKLNPLRKIWNIPTQNAVCVVVRVDGVRLLDNVIF
jgi:pantoate--beta-alanine ligase